jgi:flagellar basal body-associated protein FliL
MPVAIGVIVVVLLIVIGAYYLLLSRQGGHPADIRMSPHGPGKLAPETGKPPAPQPPQPQVPTTPK